MTKSSLLRCKHNRPKSTRITIDHLNITVVYYLYVLCNRGSAARAIVGRSGPKIDNYNYVLRTNSQLPTTQTNPPGQRPRPRLSKMFTSGLTNTPITKHLLIYIIASSVLLSILDSKHLASIHVSPHLWQYGQFWRAVIWQVAGFANSTEALFAAVLVYHLRVVERAWGRRKLLVCFRYNLYTYGSGDMLMLDSHLSSRHCRIQPSSRQFFSPSSSVLCR